MTDDVEGNPAADARQMLVDYFDRADIGQIEKVIERNVHPISGRSFDDVISGLSELMGEAAASALVATMLAGDDGRDETTNSDSVDITDQLEGRHGESLNYLRALYRAKLRRSFQWFRGYADDWASFQREVLWDSVADDWIVESAIEKINGELVVFRTPTSSTARLASYLLKSLSLVPAKALEEEGLKQLFDQVEVLRSHVDQDSASPEAD